MGLIGQSGSGKTTLGRCLIGLETASEGAIEIDGVSAADFAALSREERSRLRRLMQMVFQDPYSALNPRHSVRRCLSEALRAGGVPREAFAARVEALLRDVGLPPDHAERRPASLSGGERQRVAIARALAVRPRLLVCDEPVSSLDISVQAQILNLFKGLQREHGLSYLFISHDPAVIRQMADRVYVLHRGEVVEHGPAEEVLSNPGHPYTRHLIRSGAERPEAPPPQAPARDRAAAARAHCARAVGSAALRRSAIEGRTSRGKGVTAFRSTPPPASARVAQAWTTRATRAVKAPISAEFLGVELGDLEGRGVGPVQPVGARVGQRGGHARPAPPGRRGDPQQAVGALRRLGGDRIGQIAEVEDARPPRCSAARAPRGSA